MTKSEFVKAVQDCRGGLKSQKYVDLMGDIYDNGIPSLRALCYRQKQMGIENFADVANLSEKSQLGWYHWLEPKGFKAPKNELELKYIELLEDDTW